MITTKKIKINEPDLISKIGSLDKESFDYLGGWRIYLNGSYGFAHRLGIKKNYVDSEGDKSVLFLHFIYNVKEVGKPEVVDITDCYNRNIEKVVTESTVIFANLVDNAVGAVMDPPKYMVDELEEILKAKRPF